MSAANVELVRRIHEHWDRDESMRDLVADDLEYVNPAYAVEPGTRVGRRWFGSVRETYPDFLFHVERYVDTDGDDVVVLGRYTASGSASGVSVEGEHGYVWTVRDGRAVRFRWFQSHSEALEAAGLSSG
jgi:ketosteroid isomerase-like protein